MVTPLVAVQCLDVGPDVVAGHFPQVVITVRPFQQGRPDTVEVEPDRAFPSREVAGATVTQDAGPALGLRADAGCETLQTLGEPALEGGFAVVLEDPHVLRTGKRQAFAINTMAAARYRDRHSVSRKKSDPGDALVLANILRTDMHAHRPLPNDSDLGRAVAVLARAQQDSLWNRQQLANQLRSLLREYYPAALAAFEPWRNGLCRPEARELLKAAPTLTRAARLTRTQLEAALKRAGRKRGITAEAERLHRSVFRAAFGSEALPVRLL